MSVTRYNHPNTIFLGSVTEWKNWDLPKIDLVIGGSPCQGFSFSGKQLNFEDSRSKLFFEFVDVLKYYKPKYFLLENVKMKQEYKDVISSILGSIYSNQKQNLFETSYLDSVLINSSLVSAQSRERLYWSNVEINQPQPKQIFLSDIIEENISELKTYYLDKKHLDVVNNKLYLQNGKSQFVLTKNETVLHNLYGGFKEKFPRIFNSKSPTLRTARGGGHIPSVLVDWIIGEEIALKHRLLTPLECERLQTAYECYTKYGLTSEGVKTEISNTQRYKMLGNGWTIEVIKNIFNNMYLK